MTKSGISFVAALGFLAAGLVAAAPASAGSLSIAKPVVVGDQSADLQRIDGGSWKKKQYFKSKKHYRGGDYYGGHDDHFYKRHKKKKRRRAYRHGYDEGYYEGRRDGRYYDRRGYGYYDDFRPRFRGRGHHRGRGHRFGSGYIRTPGFYFRF